MARLGELLVAGGLLTPEQLEQALRAQVMWGGRLGTNLIELGFLDLDALSQALGRQHHLPAALGRHFEKVDRELQRMLSEDFAERFSVVPLVRVGPERKVVIASIEPLAKKPLAIIADELAVDPTQLIPSVAAELRIRYQLERIYQIPRKARFMRSPGKSVPPFPAFGEIPDQPLTDPQIPIPNLDIHLPTDTAELPIYQQTSAQAAGIAAAAAAAAAAPEPQAPPPADDLAIRMPGVSIDVDFDVDVDVDLGAEAAEADQADEADQAAQADEIVGDLDDLSALAVIDGDELAVPSEVDETPSGRERRRYVQTIADAEPAPTPADEKKKLGRISIRKVAVSTAGQAAGLTLGEATRSIRRAKDRDQVATLVIDTLFRYAPSCEAALMLVLRGDVAISWKGFVRSGATPPEMAVPLQQSGLFPKAVAGNTTVRAVSTDLGPIDQLLMVSLGQQSGELIVVPVSIGTVVMCLIAMVTVKDAPIASAESIAVAAGAAFARLMRNASR